MTNITVIKSVCNFSQVRSLQNLENRYLLIANGNNILTYSIQGSSIFEEPISTNQIFSCFGITKIIVESPLKTKHFVVTLGNRYLAVNRFLLECGNLCQEEKTRCHINLHDWALDAAFQINCDDIINVVSAGNRVTSVNWKRGEKLHTYECTTSCILYSAKLRNSSVDGQLIVTGGTVFKQIFIWFVDIKDKKRKYPVAHHLHSHDGVIFDIDYCAKYHKLASASDDRSIRVWSHPETDRPQIIESPEHILYGHQSRVWCVKFVDSDDALYDSLLISGGEDGSAFVWNHQIGTKILSVNLSSSSLWSVSQSKDPTRLFYGSNYGRVISCDLISRIKNLPTNPFCESNFKTTKREADILTSLSWVAEDTVISINKSGVIKLSTIDETTQNLSTIVISVRGLNTEDCFESYSTTAVSSYNQIAVGDKVGKIYLFNISRGSNCADMSIDYSQILNAHDGDSKVCGLVWLDNNTLLSSDVFGRIKVWKVDIIEDITCIGNHQLPKSRHSWVTTASFIKSHKGNYRIVIGDRSGGVYFYKEGQVDPQNCYPKLHGMDGVSSVQPTEKDKVYTTGRDGRVMELSLIEDQLILMRTFFKSKFIEWSCRLILDPDDGSPIRVIGFHSTDFIEYDLRMSRVSWSVSCGGGHRLWLYNEDDQGTINFIYTKHGTLCKESKNTSEINSENMAYCGKYPPLCSAYHSSQIRCCVIISRNYRNHHTLFATGGDDNLIVIQRFDSSRGTNISVLQTLYGHISSVKSLATTRFSDSDVDYLLVSGGGRCQMIFWKITLSNNCDDITTREIKNISIDDFENPKTHKEMKRKLWKKKDLNHDGRCGEARIMDMSVECEKNECGDISFTIACACSDSIFRLFHLDYDPVLDNYSLKLANSISGDGSCLNVARLLSSTTCLIGSNEGSLMKYSKRDGDTWKQVNKWRLHSRGVMDIATENESINRGHLLVASVGDDNQLNVVRLKSNNDCCYIDEDFRLSNKYAHDAQASGVVILDKVQQFLSCSIDQRVTLWKVKNSSSSSSVSNKQQHETTNNHLLPVASTISNVADITGCCILNESSASNSVTSSLPTSTTTALYIIIYGFGLEILKLLR